MNEHQVVSTIRIEIGALEVPLGQIAVVKTSPVDCQGITFEGNLVVAEVDEVANTIPVRVGVPG
ncbi:MAG: hypothetical protein ABI134_06560, partial [Byssovorax sp.]